MYQYLGNNCHLMTRHHHYLLWLLALLMKCIIRSISELQHGLHLLIFRQDNFLSSWGPIYLTKVLRIYNIVLINSFWKSISFFLCISSFYFLFTFGVIRMHAEIPARQVCKTVIEVSPAIQECQKESLRSTLEGDTPCPEFFSKWEDSVLPRGVNPSCNVVWPVLRCSGMSTGYAALTSIKFWPYNRLLTHRLRPPSMVAKVEALFFCSFWFSGMPLFWSLLFHVDFVPQVICQFQSTGRS